MHVIDPMHNLYLGTAKWVSKGILNTVKLAEINRRILSLHVPAIVTFSRLPADIEHSSSLTAEQWMIWVNYYSIFCLYDLLPHNQFECWRHFVQASRLLCKEATVTSVADALLLHFWRRFESIYGSNCVTLTYTYTVI